MQLEAAHFEEQLPLLEALFRVLEGKPQTLVPDDDFTGAVVALGNDALEVGVLHRMVLDHHGEALFRDVGGRALGNGPAHECAAPLESEVVVEPGRRVFLDHEHPGFGPVGLVGKSKAAKGFGGLGGRAFGAVRLEGSFLVRRHLSLLSTGADFYNSADLERIAALPRFDLKLAR